MNIFEQANINELAHALKTRLQLFEDLKGSECMPKKRIKIPSSPACVKTAALIKTFLHESGPEPRLKDLQDSLVGNCQRCKLRASRTQLVFGSGSENADLVFVGEAPGDDEDKSGTPFVGRSGQLLTKMIEAMGLSREQVYICNVIKCRPPENRNPEEDEIAQCEPFLKAQLAVIKPKVIVTLGRFACQSLLRSEETISQIRGNWTSYEGIDLMPTYHPAYLLRNPSKKKDVWTDLQAVMERLGLPAPLGEGRVRETSVITQVKA